MIEALRGGKRFVTVEHDGAVGANNSDVIFAAARKVRREQQRPVNQAPAQRHDAQ